MKKLILLIAATFAVASAKTESEITKKMKEFKIIPDIIPNQVPELLKITFDSGASVNMGNEITPSEAKNQPKVEWNADKNAFYTIVCFDPDAPSPKNPSISNLVTWLVGNISGNDIDSGYVLAEYYAIAPPRGKDANRGIFALFKQPSKLNFDEKPIDKYTIEGRTNYPLNEFTEKYGLGGPVAGNFYLTKFDSYVMEVYDMLNCCFEYNEPEE
ncbi:protein D3-like [Episyrphus balteatus]|uniref:protein D3-like n=1 Tax=Episyrphus balteatus TaxID=286459 RepID=UPI0024850692|nr:protein D3-like [Episyrphus balteatus]